MVHTAASVASNKWAGFAEIKDAVRADNWQPVPVIEDIIACPFSMAKAFSLLHTRSIAPVIAIIAPVFLENSCAKRTTSLIFSFVTLSAIFASTPFVVPLPKASVLISEIFPRITENWISSKSFRAVCVLSVEAPTPTGSKTTGWWSSLAFFPAISMDSIVRELSVPILILRPVQMEVISATSSWSSAIIGEAPQARTTLAQSLTVT